MALHIQSSLYASCPHQAVCGHPGLLCQQSPLLGPLRELGTTQPVWLLGPTSLGGGDCFHQEASPVLSDPFPGPLPSSRGQHVSQASSPPFEAGVPVLAPLAQREKPSRIFANPTPQTPVQPSPPAFIPLKEQNPLCGLITPKGTVRGCTCVL